MGDRCFLHIDARPKDARILAKALGDDLPNYAGEKPTQEVGDNGLVEIEIEESDCGGCEGLGEAARAGAAFIGWHTAGANYPAQAFASDESSDEPAFVDSGHEGGYVVAVGEDGTPEPSALKWMSAFVDCRTRVEKLHIAARPVVSVCENCGSSNVALQVLAWFDVNGDGREEWDGSTDPADGRCYDCGLHSLYLVDEQIFRSGLVELKGVGSWFNPSSRMSFVGLVDGTADLSTAMHVDDISSEWVEALSPADLAIVSKGGKVEGVGR